MAPPEQFIALRLRPSPLATIEQDMFAYVTTLGQLGVNATING
jgi:hypothetical protein